MTRPSLTLVVLAAGLGSRFGGLKQLEAVGPGGATLMDYSVYDAMRCSFTGVLFVIREDMDGFEAFAQQRYGRRLQVRTAIQRLTDHLPAGATVGGRSKPWGTAHAVLSARGGVTGPFVVVNADDFYGEPAFRAAAEFFDVSPAVAAVPEWAVVGYRLSDTLSPSGGVSRALCRANDGWLRSVEELHDIKRDASGTIHGTRRGAPVTLHNDDLVSMNMWAFTPAVFRVLEDQFAVFHASRETSSGEFLIPAAVQAAVETGAARVNVLDPASRWFGMTYRSDRPAVQVALGELVAAGRYPERLW